jgi:hypothetical protein
MSIASGNPPSRTENRNFVVPRAKIALLPKLVIGVGLLASVLWVSAITWGILRLLWIF